VAAIVQDTAMGGTCNVTAATTIMTIGATNGPSNKPSTVSGGTVVCTTRPSGVTITCSVVATGSGFDVDLLALQSGAMAGGIRIYSTPGQGAVTPTGGTVTAQWQNPMVGNYSESDCTFSPMYDQMPLPAGAGPAVAGGRIWGHVSCPRVTGLPMMSVCDAEADFLFENCAGS
jgi:hypothetical protein